MEDFSDFLEKRLNYEGVGASEARRDLFELQKDEEYRVVNKLMELCGDCRSCGSCCRDLPCQLEDYEISEVCEYLDMGLDDFMNSYAVERDNAKYLKTPCPFLREDNICKIYTVRPEICRWHPVKILLPFTYQVRVSKDCGLGHEIGRKFDLFIEEHSFEELKMSSELRETLLEFSDETIENSHHGGSRPFLIMESSTLHQFVDWLEE